MKKQKRVFILAVVIFAGLAFGSFFTADLLGYFYKLDIFYPNIPKLLLSASACLLAWSITTEAVERRDRDLLRAFYLCIFPGDVAMAFSSVKVSGIPVLFFAGFVLFLVAHVVMLIRLLSRLKGGRPWKIVLVRSNMLAAGVVLVLATLVVLLIYPGLNAVGLGGPAAAYCYLIAIDVGLAWLVLMNHGLPGVDRYFIFIGYLCFFASDLTTALYNSYPGTDFAALANCFIWVTYAPAIILISLSGTDWRGTALAAV